MGTWREQLQADLQLKGITPRTQHNYLREADNLEQYFSKSPEELQESEIKDYLLHLLHDKKMSEGTFRFYVAALKTLYRTLNREWLVEKICYPKRKKTLPVVLDLPRLKHCLPSPKTSNTRQY